MKYNFITYIQTFGLKIFISKLLKKVFWKGKTKFSALIRRKNEEIITQYLMKNVVSRMELQKISEQSNSVPGNTPKIIWIMWWQGLEYAPDIVKLCIFQIQKQNPNCEIRIIDQFTYEQYVTVPAKLMDNVKGGKISITHLSDYLRVHLLAQYGGVWMDATLFVTKPLNSKIFESAFYTLRDGVDRNDPAHGRWTIFFMASSPQTPILIFLSMFLETYFDSFDNVIDYLLIDYGMMIAYNIIPDAQNCIDGVPLNNVLWNELYPTLNVDAKEGKAILNDQSTSIFKLSWKSNLIRTFQGEETTYGYMLRVFD